MSVRWVAVWLMLAGCGFRPLDLGAFEDAGPTVPSVYLRIVDGRPFTASPLLAGASVRLETDAGSYEGTSGTGGRLELTGVVLDEGELADLTVVTPDETFVLSVLGLDVSGTSADAPLSVAVGALSRCGGCDRAFYRGDLGQHDGFIVTSAPETVAGPYVSPDWYVQPPSRLAGQPVPVTAIEIDEAGIVRAIGSAMALGPAGPEIALIQMAALSEPFDVVRADHEALSSLPARVMVVHEPDAGGVDAVLGLRELGGPGPWSGDISYALPPLDGPVVLNAEIITEDGAVGVRSRRVFDQQLELQRPPDPFVTPELIEIGVTTLVPSRPAWANSHSIVIATPRAEWHIVSTYDEVVLPALPASVPLERIVRSGELARVGVAAGRFGQEPTGLWLLSDPMWTWDQLQDSAWDLRSTAQITE